MAFESIDQSSSSWLERPCEVIEVYQVIGGMAKDIAPSRNGFSMAFFHDCWEVITEDIMKVFYKFHFVGKLKKKS